MSPPHRLQVPLPGRDHVLVEGSSLLRRNLQPVPQLLDLLSVALTRGLVLCFTFLQLHTETTDQQSTLTFNLLQQSHLTKQQLQRRYVLSGEAERVGALADHILLEAGLWDVVQLLHVGGDLLLQLCELDVAFLLEAQTDETSAAPQLMW